MNTTAHILVIRLSAMGDVAMTVPVLLALLQRYPKLKITILTRAFFKPIFSQIPNVSVFEADVKGSHKGVVGLWKLYKALNVTDFYAVADLHNVLRSNILKLMFRSGNTAFFQVDKGRKEKRALTSATNKKFVRLKSTHQRYADVFTALGFPVTLALTPMLPKQPLTDNLSNLIVPSERKLIGIAPFAAFEGKSYPLEQMAEVIGFLKKSGQYLILLFGGGTSERKLLDRFADGKNCINTIEKLSFQEELALISNLDVMLAMDSGNAHLSAMYAVPTITLWGVTHPYAGFAPFGQEQNVLLADRQKFPLVPTSVYGNKAPKGYEKAIASIPPQKIIAKIAELSGL